MKKIKQIILLAVVAFSLSFAGGRVSASHLMGGEIFCTHLTGNDYQLVARFYRDTLGVTMSGFNFTIQEVGGAAWSTSSYVPVGPGNWIGNGVEEYIFLDTITFPNAGEFEIYTESCCRNAAILNMSNPSGESMNLVSVVTVPASPAVNSTPIFLNLPVSLAQVNIPFVYNPIPYDPDGDSLAWSFMTPRSSGGSPVAGYTLPAGSAPFAIDPQNGEITWTPNALGNYSCAVLVEEYRGGQLIGSIIRDMQILVVSGTGNSTRAQFSNTNGWPVNAQGNYQFTVPVNNSFNLTIVANDPDLNPLSMSANGEPFLHTTNPAAFSSQYNSQTGDVTGTFTWAPDNSQLRDDPYIVAFRTVEFVNGMQLAEDVTVLFETTQATGIEDPQNLTEMELFPNPAQDAFSLRFDLPEASHLNISIMDLTGRIVGPQLSKMLSAGTQLVSFRDLHLESGIYLVRVKSDSGMEITKKLLIK